MFNAPHLISFQKARSRTNFYIDEKIRRKHLKVLCMHACVFGYGCMWCSRLCVPIVRKSRRLFVVPHSCVQNWPNIWIGKNLKPFGIWLVHTCTDKNSSLITRISHADEIRNRNGNAKTITKTKPIQHFTLSPMKTLSRKTVWSNKMADNYEPNGNAKQYMKPICKPSKYSRLEKGKIKRKQKSKRLAKRLQICWYCLCAMVQISNHFCNQNKMVCYQLGDSTAQRF